MTSPTQRTLAELRKRGYLAAVVERFNSFARIRIDLYGFADVLAIRPGEFFAVQACAAASHAARRDKLLRTPGCRAWLEAGGRVEVWSWGLKGEHGKRKVYELRAQSITIGDMGVEAGPALDTPRKLAQRERAQAKRAQTRLRLSPPPTLH